MEHLPLPAAIEDYEQQAAAILRGHAHGDVALLKLIHENHPKCLDGEVRWLPLPVTNDDIRAMPFAVADARLTLSQWYGYRDWGALVDLVSAIGARIPGVYDFELAAEAVVTGDPERLEALLRAEPGLVRTRSSRVTCHDPAVHRATLLHYVAANGVEDYRQRTPGNAVEIARILLEAGADPNALADMYGGRFTPLSMLVSSSPPHEAGVQVALIDALLDYGADPDERGNSKWASPVLTALVFGFVDAALALVRRGARTDRLAVAAGLGRLPEIRASLPQADALERHRALALAAQLGRAEIVRILLNAGESPDRFNPDGLHAHSTPLHQAALAGHEEVVRMLVERGARLDITDKLWKGTPRGWAEYGGHQRVAEYLRENELR